MAVDFLSLLQFDLFSWFFDLIGISSGTVIPITLGIAVYIYFAFAWMTVAKKLSYTKPWLAWIPFANLYMIIRLGKMSPVWFYLPLGFMLAGILSFFSIIGIIFIILGGLLLTVILLISQWKVFESRNYPGWLILLTLIPLGFGTLIYYIEIGFVAWKDRKTKNKILKEK